jgi:putative membrane protein
MTNNVLEILNLRRLSAEKSKYQKWLPYLLLICFVDALLVTTIDLYMDPISVKAGAWTWLDRGIYFGVPLGNYIGWFFVTFVSSLIIRTLDYYFPSKSDIPDSLFLMPVYGLIFLWLSFTLTAIFYQLYSLVIVGTFVMLPIPLISVLMSWSWPKRISK